MVTPVTKAQFQSDIREALEKKVLTFMAASSYEAVPAQMASERGLTFTPLPPMEFDEADPAANSCIMVIDHDASEPSPENGNYLISDSKKDYTQMFDLLFDLTNMLVVKLKISNGTDNESQNLVKYLVVNINTNMEELCYELSALLKIMQGGSVGKGYNSFVLAVRDNRNSIERR